MDVRADSLELIKRGADELLIEAELVEKLKTGRPLRIKAGFDPTAPDLHLGHTVLINKLRHFQDLGHHVMFLIGDFTGMIGDPTGKNATRPLCRASRFWKTPELIRNRYSRYSILKNGDLFQFHLVRADWRSRDDQTAALHTVARMLERDDFSKRYANGQPIAIHEFLYPLCQGYDSGCHASRRGTWWNRPEIQPARWARVAKHYGQTPQCVLMMPLLEGLDGVNKMSKSLGNYVGINEPPREIFGKLMSISDVLMWRYYDLLSFCGNAGNRAS